jgi:hypothetical protein
MFIDAAAVAFIAMLVICLMRHSLIGALIVGVPFLIYILKMTPYTRRDTKVFVGLSLLAIVTTIYVAVHG